MFSFVLPIGYFFTISNHPYEYQPFGAPAFLIGFTFTRFLDRIYFLLGFFTILPLTKM